MGDRKDYMVEKKRKLYVQFSEKYQERGRGQKRRRVKEIEGEEEEEGGNEEDGEIRRPQGIFEGVSIYVTGMLYFGLTRLDSFHLKLRCLFCESIFSPFS